MFYSDGPSVPTRPHSVAPLVPWSQASPTDLTGLISTTGFLFLKMFYLSCLRAFERTIPLPNFTFAGYPQLTHSPWPAELLICWPSQSPNTWITQLPACVFAFHLFPTLPSQKPHQIRQPSPCPSYAFSASQASGTLECSATTDETGVQLVF